MGKMKTRIYRYVNRGQGRKIDKGRWPEVRFVENQNHHDLLTGSKLKRIFLLLFSLVFLITSIVDAENQDNYKVLVLGVRADAPPFSSFDSKKEKPDEAKGYTVDLCTRIAERAVQAGLYCSFDYKEVKAADRFKTLRSGEINILCGATTVTLERMRVADFSLFTFLSGASVMYLEENTQKNDEKNKPLRVGVLGKTTSENEAKRILQNFQRKNDNFGLPAPRNVEVKAVEDHYRGLEQLKEGTIEAYVADREILLALRQKDMLDNSTTDIVVSEDYYTVEPYAIGIEIGKSELRYIANSVLSELYDWNRVGKQDEHIFTVLSSNFPRKRFSKSLEALFRFQRITRGQQILEPVEEVKCP